ncbi:MAG: RloB family protein [Gemmataceae bacterium]|nr:RloB family protein [Gemmataceae bacterium]
MKRRRRGSGGKRTRGEKTPRRPSAHRSEKTRILIVCEGRETEPNYFRGLRDEEAVQQHFSIVVLKGKGGSCLAVVQQAIAEQEKAAARRKEFDEVWCVFDVEQARQREQVIKARALAGQHEIRPILSNPSFEVWLLAHFVRTKKSFPDGNAVIAELNKHWPGAFGQDYEKNDEQLYARLANRTATAIDNARKVREQDWGSALDLVDCNSATDIYLLVERLLNPSK